MKEKYPVSGFTSDKEAIFVHQVLETAVKEKVEEKQALYKIAEALHKEPDWMYVNFELTLPLFEVFWLRNKDRISNNFMVEKWFTVPIEGFAFKGKIDRVDLLDPFTKGVEIIDYKTGKSDVSHRRSLKTAPALRRRL